MSNHLVLGGGPTLESLVTEYRRRSKDVELEVRFPRIDYAEFAQVLALFLDGKIPVASAELTQTINVLMPDKGNASRRGRSDNRRAVVVRQMEFKGGVRQEGDYYYRKTPITRLRNTVPQALDYDVVLSSEQELGEGIQPLADTSAVIRVKVRASFTVRPEGTTPWRADLTVVRQVTGADAAVLPAVRDAMFRAASPSTMLADLRLGSPAQRGLYKYEAELEFIPEPTATAIDAVRPSHVMAAVDQILSLTNPKYQAEAEMQSEVFFAATQLLSPSEARYYLHERGLKSLASKVTTLTRHEYKKMYPPVGYTVLIKTDGVRAFAVAHHGRLAVVSDRLRTFAPPPAATRVGGPGPPAWKTAATVVDGELHRAPGGDEVFYAFDVIQVKGKRVAQLDYPARLKHLGDAVEVLRNFGLAAEPKDFVHITAGEPEALKAQFDQVLAVARPYNTDGLILVAPTGSYLKARAYKWKPIEDTTIDFLARKAPRGLLRQGPYAEREGHDLYLLFSGINPYLYEALSLERISGYESLFGVGVNAKNYFPVQFSTPDAPYAHVYHHPKGAPAVDKQIVEMRCGRADGPCAVAGSGSSEPPEWTLVRVREDRARGARNGDDFGNDFNTAVHNWTNYIDPFGQALLWEGAAGGYFAAEKAPMYRAQTAFISFAKTKRIEESLTHATLVIDGGVGNGQDLGRYFAAQVKYLVGIDADQGAISELIRRQLSHIRQARKGGRRSSKATGRRSNKAGGRTTMYAIRADLKQPWKKTAAVVRGLRHVPDRANAFVMNLAVHYLAGSAADLANLADLCRDVVKPGGLVIFTAMLGERVHELLGQVRTGESWDSRQGDVLKYSIRRDYTSDTLTTAGQQVGVLLPFSNGEYYPEYLVNVAAFRRIFGDRGFELAETHSLGRYLEDFAIRSPRMFKLLTAEDKKYVSLYGEIVFRRAAE